MGERRAGGEKRGRKRRNNGEMRGKGKIGRKGGVEWGQKNLGDQLVDQCCPKVWQKNALQFFDRHSAQILGKKNPKFGGKNSGVWR